MLKRRGILTSKKRVERIMREYDIQGVSKAKRQRRKQVIEERDEKVFDLVKRNFYADGPNELWFADITYVKTYEGWPCRHGDPRWLVGRDRGHPSSPQKGVTDLRSGVSHRRVRPRGFSGCLKLEGNSAQNDSAPLQLTAVKPIFGIATS